MKKAIALLVTIAACAHSVQADTAAEMTGTVDSFTSPPATPEPATATLSLLALAGLAARRRRK